MGIGLINTDVCKFNNDFYLVKEKYYNSNYLFIIPMQANIKLKRFPKENQLRMKLPIWTQTFSSVNAGIHNPKKLYTLSILLIQFMTYQQNIK